VVLSMEVFQRALVPASNPNPSVGEECRKADLDTTMGEGARRLDLNAARILSEVVAATWKVHQLRDILPMTSWEPGYSKNHVTQQRSSHV
jgi:hypothetical protein